MGCAPEAGIASGQQGDQSFPSRFPLKSSTGAKAVGYRCLPPPSKPLLTTLLIEGVGLSSGTSTGTIAWNLKAVFCFPLTDFLHL